MKVSQHYQRPAGLTRPLAIYTLILKQQQQCGVFVTPRRKLEFAAAACSYLRVFEEGGDASDVQAEASRGASRAVNAAGEERLVLLPRAHAPRAH